MAKERAAAQGVGEAPPRARILEAAARLFYEEGIHATGVDRVVAEAGVAKMTLYKHFPSKEALVLEVARHEDVLWRGAFRERFAALGDRAPRDQILGAFDLLDSRLHEAEFRGCPFVRAAAEYSALEAPVHQIAAGFKRFTCDLFEELAVAAEMSEPKELAMELTLLFEGAIVTSFVMGDQSLAANARRAAAALVDARLAEGRSVEAPQVGRGS